ncbi:MAG: hypothetical protein ACTSRP_13345 [Candidatus Helarchaeota archaeon]
MSSIITIEKIIKKIQKDNPSLEEINNYIQKIKAKLNSDFDLIFKISKNISIYHDLIKEIGYISSLLTMGLEGLFDYNNIINEIIPHLQNIARFYQDNNINTKLE